MSSRKFLDARDPAVFEEGEGRVVLFKPFIPPEAAAEVTDTLASRWVGQGPKVDRFEQAFAAQLGVDARPVAVGSGTDALHLSYRLAGIGPGDEVVVPVFTCTATNLPLVYQGAVLKFADIEPDTLNVSAEHVGQLVNERTKAIVCVHYGGLPCDLAALQRISDERGIPIVEDAAQALGASFQGQPIGGISPYTVFSFQAIKHITTGDGGMLMVRDEEQARVARRLRWFGIDREAKFRGHWENDIREVGYKYQMTDIAAAMGLAALPHLSEVVAHRQRLLAAYDRQLQGVPGIQVLGAGCADRVHGAWLCTVAADNRRGLEARLHEHGIESAQVHYRNDRYTVFAAYRDHELPNMDAMEDRYQLLPLHTHVQLPDVERICDVIRSGW